VDHFVILLYALLALVYFIQILIYSLFSASIYEFLYVCHFFWELYCGCIWHSSM